MADVLDLDLDVVVEHEAWTEIDLDALAAQAVAATLAHHDVEAAELVVLGCDDRRIAELNADFRGKPQPTNVLSWPSVERGAAEDGGVPLAPRETELGDIAIAYETCEAEALAGGVPIADHVTHLLIHATLHLLGYDHERDADAALMERIEIEILAKLGLPDPYEPRA